MVSSSGQANVEISLATTSSVLISFDEIFIIAQFTLEKSDHNLSHLLHLLSAIITTYIDTYSVHVSTLALHLMTDDRLGRGWKPDELAQSSHVSTLLYQAVLLDGQWSMISWGGQLP